MWEFLSRLEELLPVASFFQVGSLAHGDGDNASTGLAMTESLFKSQSVVSEVSFS